MTQLLTIDFLEEMKLGLTHMTGQDASPICLNIPIQPLKIKFQHFQKR